MKGFVSHIDSETLENSNFRKVLYTAHHCQLVLMSLQPNEEIGEETHLENDQFFRVESGTGNCIIDGQSHQISDGFAIVVPAGCRHNIINTNKTQFLKLYTIYSPPHHKDKIIRKTKMDAMAKEAIYEGVTSE